MSPAKISAARIWRTVVFAGATLGAPACHRSKPAVSPDPIANPAPVGDVASAPAAKPVLAPAAATTPNDAPKPPPDPKPAATNADDATTIDELLEGNRARGGGDRPKGRGFVLA